MEHWKKLAMKKVDFGVKTKYTTFKCPELVYNLFQYCNSVDAHNESRMSPFALEETWKTHQWPCTVLSFLLAITERSDSLIVNHIYKYPLTVLSTRLRTFKKTTIVSCEAAYIQLVCNGCSQC